MTNQLIAMFGAQPWGMSADDYLDSPARLPLVGSEVAPAWDADLGAAMRHRGLAVHERSRPRRSAGLALVLNDKVRLSMAQVGLWSC